MVQKSIESLTAAIAVMNVGKKIMNDKDHHSGMLETVLSIVDKA